MDTIERYIQAAIETELLQLPAIDAEIGRWLLTIMDAAAEYVNREFRTDLATLDECQAPEQLSHTVTTLELKWPDRHERIATAAAAWHEAQHIKDNREAERQLMLERQAEVWYPFVIYRVRYGILCQDDDDRLLVDHRQLVGSESVYATCWHANDDGWWEVLQAGDGLIQMRLEHLVSVERIEVHTLDEVPSGLGLRSGDGVIVPPPGVIRLVVDC